MARRRTTSLWHRGPAQCLPAAAGMLPVCSGTPFRPTMQQVRERFPIRRCEFRDGSKHKRRHTSEIVTSAPPQSRIVTTVRVLDTRRVNETRRCNESFSAVAWQLPSDPAAVGSAGSSKCKLTDIEAPRLHCSCRLAAAARAAPRKPHNTNWTASPITDLPKPLPPASECATRTPEIPW